MISFEIFDRRLALGMSDGKVCKSDMSCKIRIDDLEQCKTRIMAYTQQMDDRNEIKGLDVQK